MIQKQEHNLMHTNRKSKKSMKRLQVSFFMLKPQIAVIKSLSFPSGNTTINEVEQDSESISCMLSFGLANSHPK